MYKLDYLDQFKGLVHGVSTRQEGNMSFRWGDNEQVLANRKNFLNKLDIDLNSTVAMHNQHTNNFKVVSEKDKGRGMENIDNAFKVDGLVTDQQGLYLFLLVADCQPVIVIEPEKKILGLFHAGWRNIVAGSAKDIVDFLDNNYEIDTSSLHVIIGPSVQQKSYRHPKLTQQGDPEWAPFIEKYGEKDYGLDLAGYHYQKFVELGISKKQISVSDIDTAEDDRFYSHVYDSQNQNDNEGRFAVIVGWKS